MYIKTSHDIKVTVVPTYMEEQSEPGIDHYVWAYAITIENLGKKTVQLLRRRWQITNATGQMQEVHGEGVVGEQPVLEEGQSFHYSSGAALSTPSGIMVGSYHMVETDSNKPFTIAIPAFSLDSPYEVVRTH